MTASAAGTALRPAIVGKVVDMPTPTVYLIEDDRTHQVFTVHDDEIYWFGSPE